MTNRPRLIWEAMRDGSAVPGPPSHFGSPPPFSGAAFTEATSNSCFVCGCAKAKHPNNIKLVRVRICRRDDCTPPSVQKSRSAAHKPRPPRAGTKRQTIADQAKLVEGKEHYGFFARSQRQRPLANPGGGVI